MPEQPDQKLKHLRNTWIDWSGRQQFSAVTVSLKSRYLRFSKKTKFWTF